MALSGVQSLNRIRNIKLASNVAFMSSKVSGTTEKSPNHELDCSQFRSRNPRNLELMRLAYKPSGYSLDKPGRAFWNKLLVKTSQSFVKAEIIHVSGSTVVVASSAEWGIKKQLYRYTDSCAYKAVGTVLAQRALECGITNVYCDIQAEKGTKLEFLIDGVQAGGVSLTEEPRYIKPNPFEKIQQIPSWEDLKLV